MLETGEQVEGDYPSMLNSGFFAETFTAVERHCASVRAPVVLIRGTYRADHLNLLQLLSITRRLTLCEVPAHVVEGSMLDRRIGLITANGLAQENADLLENICLNHPQSGAALLIPWVDLLDQESMEALALVIRRGNVGVFMTSLGEAGMGFRFSWALQSARSYQARLRLLTDAETHQLLSEILDEPPTAALAQYLGHCAGYGARALAWIARVGLTEGWIHAVRRRSVVSRMPSWLDRQSARRFCLRIREELGAPVLDLLQRIAASGHTELYELTGEAEVSDVLFVLAGAGLLSIEGTRVSISRPCDQRDLLMGPQYAVDATVDTPQAVLSARAAGHEVDPEAASAAASALLEQGLFDQARLLVPIEELPGARSAVTEACADVGEGAPFRALDRLGHTGGPQHHSDSGDSEIDESGSDGTDQTMSGLRSFISGVLLRRPASRMMQEGIFGGVIEVLDRLERVAGPSDLDGLTTVFRRRAGSPVRTAAAGELNIDLLAQVAEAAMQCYVLALRNEREEAAAALERFDSQPMPQLPLVGLNWVLEVVGRARLLTDPGAGALSQAWFQGETPERGLVRLLISEVLRLCQGLLCGEPQHDLRGGLEDLWSQFEGGLAAPGSVSRHLLEAFDFAIEGDRSEDLLGPVSLSSPRMGGPFGDPWVDVSVAIGRMLHCPAVELEGDLDSRFTGWLSLAAVQRLVIRTVILRRGASLSAPVLERLSARGEEVGVEPAVVGFVRALISEDQVVISAARRALELQHPGYTAAQRAPEANHAQEGPALRADRVALLSAREREVAQRLIAGDTDVQAAEALGKISVRTVQTHVRNIYRKLEVSSRTELRATLLIGTAGRT